MDTLKVIVVEMLNSVQPAFELAERIDSFQLLLHQIDACFSALRTRLSILIQAHCILSEIHQSADPVLVKTQEQLAKLLASRDKDMHELQRQAKLVPQLQQENSELKDENQVLAKESKEAKAEFSSIKSQLLDQKADFLEQKRRLEQDMFEARVNLQSAV